MVFNLTLVFYIDNKRWGMRTDWTIVPREGEFIKLMQYNELTNYRVNRVQWHEAETGAVNTHQTVRLDIEPWDF